MYKLTNYFFVTSGMVQALILIYYGITREWSLTVVVCLILALGVAGTSLYEILKGKKDNGGK